MMERVLLGVLLLTAGSMAVTAPAAEPVTQSPEQMIAQTPDEHLAEAVRYDAEAQRLESEAARHRSMGKRYATLRNSGSKSAWSFAGLERHCTRLAASYEQAAKDARTLAQAHRGMVR